MAQLIIASCGIHLFRAHSRTALLLFWSYSRLGETSGSVSHDLFELERVITLLLGLKDSDLANTILGVAYIHIPVQRLIMYNPVLAEFNKQNIVIFVINDFIRESPSLSNRS
jgi:hypothetical protein